MSYIGQAEDEWEAAQAKLAKREKRKHKKDSMDKCPHCGTPIKHNTRESREMHFLKCPYLTKLFKENPVG